MRGLEMTDHKNKILKILSENKKAKAYSIIRKDSILLEWINKIIPQTTNLPEQIYCIINNTTPICEFNKKKFFKDSWLGYHRCGTTQCECWKKNQTEKVSNAKKAMTEEDWHSVIEKRKITNLEKYGTEHAMQNSTIKEKAADHIIAKYGVNSTLLLPDVMEKTKQSLKSKFGVEHPSKSATIKKQAMDTCLEKYGHVVYPHSNEGRPIVRQSLKDRYNVASIAQLKFSQPIRDLLQDTELFQSEYFELGLTGLCEKYPELNYEMCRSKLIREGITDVYNFTKPESFVKDILDSNDIGYQFNTRKIIPPFEIDFYIPSKKLAIEICGLYWHREQLLNNTEYHVQKLEKCLKQGIQLLTIFSDHISQTPNIVSNRILSKLKLIPRTHHARKLKIVTDLPNKDLSDFLSKTHIQGSKLGKINLAAIDQDNNICAVMTFGPLRKSLGNAAQENNFEMYRFSTIGNIPGIASKLFSYFIKLQNPTKIISYSDRCWGEGNVYVTLGFQKSSITRPNYWYTKDFLTKLHRYNFAKHKLIENGHDSSLTEFKIMENLGYSRIYDCGSIKYEWIVRP